MVNMLRNHVVPKERSRSKVIKEIDSVFSLLVRTRDHWRCCRCHKQYIPPTAALHNSHFWKRGYMGTRFDLKNCDAICYGCHRAIEGDKQKGSWYYNWKLQQLGEEEFEKMEIRARSYAGFSVFDLEILLKICKDQYGDIKGR